MASPGAPTGLAAPRGVGGTQPRGLGPMGPPERGAVRRLDAWGLWRPVGWCSEVLDWRYCHKGRTASCGPQQMRASASWISPVIGRVKRARRYSSSCRNTTLEAPGA